MPIRTGKDYVERLRDGRRLYVNGELVRDVTAYPPYRGVIRTLAALYDAQHDPHRRDALTYPSPTSGDAVSNSFLMAGTWEEIQRRVRGERARCELTWGLMGRLPDFMNAYVTDMAAIRPFLGSKEAAFGNNAWSYYEKVREENLCLTHALADPMIDRSQGIEAQEALRIVRDTDAGLIVRGARMLSTLAPVAHEIWIGPFMPRRPDQADYALSFAVPMATPGLRFICREPYDTGRSAYDRPLSSRFDEGDAIVVFEDVLVPWERVFAARDVEICNLILPSLPGYLGLQAMVRATVKLHFLTGLASLVADTVGRSGMPRYQEMIGELIALVELAEGLLTATAHEVVANAQRWVGGGAEPEAATRAALDGNGSRLAGASAIRLFFPEAFSRAVQTLRLVGSSGLVMTATEADFANPEAAEVLQRHLRGREVSAKERVRIMKLAWDAISTEFAGRQMLYEWFFAGDPITNRIGYCMTDRLPECTAFARRLLDSLEETRN